MPRRDKKREKRYQVKAEDVIRQNREQEEQERRQQEEQEKYRIEHEKELKAQEKARKAEEQKAVSMEEEAFRKNRDKSRNTFKSEFKMNLESFTDKARENGWVFENNLKKKEIIGDSSFLEYIYNAARDTADPRLIKICNDIIKTPVDTPEKRSAFVDNIKEQVDQVLETNHALGIFKRGDLNRVSTGLQGFFSEVEFSDISKKIEADRQAREAAKAKAEAERKAELAYKAEKKAFVEQLQKNGWGDSSNEIGEYIFDEYKEMSKYKISPELKETLDTQFKKFQETKIDKKMPDTHKSRMLKEFGDAYKENAKVWAFEKRANKISGYFDSYSDRFFAEGISKEKAAAEKKIFDNAKASIDKKPQASKASKDDLNTGNDLAGRLIQDNDDVREIEAVKNAPELKEMKLHSFYTYKQADYEKASPEERVEKLKEYFKVKMSDRVGASKMDKALSGAMANEVLLETVTKAKRWNTCLKAVDSVLFEDAVLGSAIRKMSKSERAGSRKDFSEFHLKDILWDEAVQLKNEAKMKRVEEDKAFVKDINKMAKELSENIDKVDFNLLGNGSPEFRQMKEAIKDLEKFAKEKVKAGKNGIALDREAELLEKQYKAIQATKAYLDHKQKDFNEDPNRRNDKSRQKREQPRIMNAVNTLKKLENAFEVSRDRLHDRQQLLREKLSRRLEGEKKRLENAKDDNAYLKSLAICTDMVKNLNGDRWTIRNPENAKDTITNLYNEANYEYTNANVKQLMMAKDSGTKNAFREGYNRVYGIEKNDKKLTVDDIWKIQDVPKEVTRPQLKSGEQIMAEVTDYRKNLFSLQTKNKTGRHDLYNAQDMETVDKQMEKAKQKQEAEQKKGMEERKARMNRNRVMG